MLKVNDNTIGIVMNFDIFNDIISSNTSSDAFYSVGMYATDNAGGKLTFFGCATDPCDSGSDYTSSIKTVDLTQNVIEVIKIKMEYDSGSSIVKAYINDDSTAVIFFYFVFFLEKTLNFYLFILCFFTIFYIFLGCK